MSYEEQDVIWRVALASYDPREMRVWTRYLEERNPAIRCTGYRSSRTLLERLEQGDVDVLVLGGGIGNLIDRVLNGEVVDYINLLFMRFAVFNFADICVCVGVALWVLVIFLEESHSGNADAPKEP